MFRFTAVLAFWLIACFSLSAQIIEADCGTTKISERKFEKQAWFGNNEILYDILDSCAYYNAENKGNVLFRIPVKFWVYRDNNKTTGGASERELKNMMIDLNMHNINNNTGFLFYMRPDIGYINKSRHKRMGYFFEALFQTSFHRAAGCINVFVVDNFIKRTPFSGKSYVRGTYNNFNKSIIVKRNISSTSLAHEIGHFFGLLHPHENYRKGKRRQESVSRTRCAKALFRKGLNCEINGDGLCDTPAEPNLTKFVDEKCNYIGELTDNWGDVYKPATNNIMSYPKYRRCRNSFTPQQVAVMIYTAKAKNIDGWEAKHKPYKFDAFEPDNSKMMASMIYPYKMQYHTFHKTYMGKNNPDKPDNVDWLKFRLKRPITKKLIIRMKNGECYSPEIKIYCFGENDKQYLSQKCQTENSCSFTISNLKKGWYYLKIENLSPKIPDDSITDFYISIEK